MSNENNLSYLLSLIGRKVRTYKGGPESREGILLQVKSDYIALLTDQNEVVYYQTMHLKSVVEDTKANFQSTTEADTKPDVLNSESFKDMLGQLKSQNVQIDRGGPESLKGKLVDVYDDFLVLQTENDGVVFYQIHHIKSISVDQGSSKENSNQSIPEVTAEVFSDLLKGYQHSWITINRGGPESVEGVLADITSDYVTVIHHEKVFRITNYHIRNISHGSKHDQKKQQEGENSENKEDNQDNQNNQNNQNEDSTNEKNKDQENDNNTEQMSKQDSKQTNQEKSSKKSSSKNSATNSKKEAKQIDDNQSVQMNTDVSNSNEDKSNKKKVIYDMLMSQVAANLEEALNKAKNRRN
jgi:spore coat protein B